MTEARKASHQKELITDGQLKAAMDYQRSRGGKLLDVLVKLDSFVPLNSTNS